MPRKVLLAVGGTGGHLFPAQALARDLEGTKLSLLFAGGKLGSNQFFQKSRFPFREISSGTPFRGKKMEALIRIGRGMMESRNLIGEFSPDLIIGFGSFYSFPLLAVAKLKRIPYILVESNVLPGRVNKLFSSGALFSAIQYEQTGSILKGNTVLAKMPFWSKEYHGITIAQADARKAYGLDPSLFTLLVFGGSQGAEVINRAVSGLKLEIPFQVLHLCGKDQDPQALEERYRERAILAHVKQFEDQMHLAWASADLAICRAGAGTMAEMELFHVPAILIPWPGATDRHQHVNAKTMEEIGGAVLLEEKEIGLLGKKIEKIHSELPKMRQNLKVYHAREIEPLAALVQSCLEKEK